MYSNCFEQKRTPYETVEVVAAASSPSGWSRERGNRAKRAKAEGKLGRRHLELFPGRPPVKIVKTLNERQSTLLAESPRSFLDKSGKEKE